MCVYILIVIWSSIVSALPADLDTTFGNSNGYITHDFNPTTSRGTQFTALAEQPDGKLLVATFGVSNAFLNARVGIARFTVTGDLDTSFGSSGTTGVLTSGEGGPASKILVDSQGRILVLYQQRANGAVPLNIRITRLDSSGALDATFGTGGTVTTLVAGGGTAGGDQGKYGADMVFDSAERILVVAGPQDGLFSTAGSGVTTILRYDSTGALDATYGVAGVADLPAPTYTQWIGTGAVNNPTDDSLYVYMINSVNTNTAPPDTPARVGIAKILSSGTPDGSFGTNGLLIVDISPAVANTSANATIFGPAHNVMLSGDVPVAVGVGINNTTVYLTVVRATPAGLVANTLNTTTFTPPTTVPAGAGSDAALENTWVLFNLTRSLATAQVQSNGSIVVAGMSVANASEGTNQSGVPFVGRLTGDGLPDHTFAYTGGADPASGSVTFDPTVISGYLYGNYFSMLVRANGKIVCAGTLAQLGVNSAGTFLSANTRNLGLIAQYQGTVPCPRPISQLSQAIINKYTGDSPASLCIAPLPEKTLPTCPPCTH